MITVRNKAGVALAVGDLVVASEPPYRRVGRIVGLRPLSRRIVVNLNGAEVVSEATGWRVFARGFA